MKIIDKIVVSPTPPTQIQNAAWFDGKEIKIPSKGKYESVGGSGGGIEIVDSIDKLDPNAELGSMASVVTPGSIQETSFRDLYQPDASILDPNTFTLNTEDCFLVGGLSITPLSTPIESSSNIMLAFSTANLSLMSPIAGAIMVQLQFVPNADNTKLIGLGGIVMDVATQNQTNYTLFSINDDSSVTVNQDQIDALNDVFANNELYYLGTFMYATQGTSVPSDFYDVVDTSIKAVAGIPSITDIYVKGDKWEKLFNEQLSNLFSDIDKLNNDLSNAVTSLDNKIPTDISQLSGIDQFAKKEPERKSVYIIQQNEDLTVESNTDYFIVQLFEHAIIIPKDVEGSITLNICTTSKPDIKYYQSGITFPYSPMVTNINEFDYGRQFISLYKNNKNKWECILETLSDFSAYYKVNFSVSRVLTYSSEIGGKIYVDDVEIASGETISAGVHQIAVFNQLKIDGTNSLSSVTHAVFAHGVDTISVYLTSSTESLHIPQTIRKAFGQSQLSEAPLPAVHVSNPDVLFKIHYYNSGTNVSPYYGFLYNRGVYRNFIDNDWTLPSDVEELCDASFCNFKGLYDSNNSEYSQVRLYLNRGILIWGSAFDNANMSFYIRNSRLLEDISLNSYWYTARPFQGKSLGMYNVMGSPVSASIFLGVNTVNLHGVNVSELAMRDSDVGILSGYINYLRIYPSVIHVDADKFKYSTIYHITMPLSNRWYDTRDNCNAIIESDSNTLVLGSSNNTIPNSVTTIGANAYRGRGNVGGFTIPSSVIYIQSDAFAELDGITYYDFSTHESIPVIGSSVFLSIPSTCKIIVPDALYDEWIAATNWSTYASYIIKKSDWDASQTTE